MIFVNFKTYSQSTGENALELAKSLENEVKKYNVPVAICVQPSGIKETSRDTSLAVWAQHIDPYEPGAHTGSTLAEAVAADGARGTLLNHSEHKFSKFPDLKKACERARLVGLKILIFAKDIEELKKVIKLKPDYVSYEPPELIGSATTSVSEAKPEVVKEAVEISSQERTPLIIGAGIHSRKDIESGLEYGASGFAIASGIVKADDPAKALGDLLKGYK